MKFIAAALFVMFLGGFAGPPGLMVGAMICVIAWLGADEITFATLRRPVPPSRRQMIPAPANHERALVSSIRSAIPTEQPIRRTLVELTEEVAALDETIRRARQQLLRGELTDRFQQRQQDAARLTRQSIERVGAATRGFERLTPPVELIDTLTRQDEKLSHLTQAVRSARGVLASVIVTGIGDQRELERAAASLTVLSQALCEAMTIGLTDEVAFCHSV